MIAPCRLIYPYYDNPGMLELQVENWNRFEGALREAIEIIVVDDCSSKPALPIMEKCRTPRRVFRVRSAFRGTCTSAGTSAPKKPGLIRCGCS